MARVGKQRKRRLKTIRRKSPLETQDDHALQSNVLQMLDFVLTMNVQPFEIFDFEKNNQTSSRRKKSARETPCGNAPQRLQRFIPPSPLGRAAARAKNPK